MCILSRIDYKKLEIRFAFIYINIYVRSHFGSSRSHLGSSHSSCVLLLVCCALPRVTTVLNDWCFISLSVVFFLLGGDMVHKHSVAKLIARRKELCRRASSNLVLAKHGSQSAKRLLREFNALQNP